MTDIRRMPSRPRHLDEPEERVPESVFLALHGIREDMAANKSDTDLKIAKLTEVVTSVVASSRTETAKIIAGVVTAAITVIGGQRLLAPAAPPPAPTNVPARSALDVRLDQCRPMPPGPGREECFARVTVETDH